jgi:hypothetical protein
LRRALVAAGAGLLAVAALAAADRFGRTARFELDGRLDRPFIQGFSPPHVRGDRVASAGATLRLPGFGALAPLALRLYVASGVKGGQVVDVEVGGVRGARQDVAAGGVLEAVGRADRAGVALVRLTGPPPHHGAGLRVGRVEVLTGAPAAPPVRRLLGLAALVALVFGWAAFVRASFGWTMAAVAGVSGAAVAWILVARVHVLGRLEALVVVLAGALVLAALGRRLGLPDAVAAVVALSAAFRLLCTLEPGFPAIDETFHAHRILVVQRGGLVTSAVAGARPGTHMEIPYAPGFHTVLAAVVPPRDARAGERAVRLAMAFFEGTAPLLLFLIARRAGAGEQAASLAAAAYAVMPEALLVIGKGIAANIAGSWVTLLVVLALFSGWSVLGLTAVMALGFLVHPGAALSLGGLVALWVALRLRRDGVAAVRGLLVALVLGAAIAFAVYFREVVPLTLRGLREVGSAPYSVQWVYLGKVLQDVVLKFGGGPFWLALVGLGAAAEPLRTLLRAWLGLAALLAGLAVFGPVPLRFEYFAFPALALAAGCGGAEISRRGRRYAVALALGLSLALQVVLGLLVLEDRFDLRNVIIPSDKWPMMKALFDEGA